MRATAALFLLAALHHAGAVFVQLLDTPGGLAHFPGLAAAVAQGPLPLAAHLTLCALREARRRQGGNGKPRRQSRRDVSVPTDHGSVSFQFLTGFPRTRHQRTLREIVEPSDIAYPQICRPLAAGTIAKLSCPDRSREMQAGPWSAAARSRARSQELIADAEKAGAAGRIRTVNLSPTNRMKLEFYRAVE
jgi:hypothetical protein